MLATKMQKYETYTGLERTECVTSNLDKADSQLTEFFCEENSMDTLIYSETVVAVLANSPRVPARFIECGAS